MKNRVAIIGIVGVPGNYGGFETMVENLIDNHELSYTVYCSSFNYKKKPKSFKNSNLVYIPIKANGIQSIFYDIYAIFHSVITGHKKLLILGVSGALIIPFIKLLPLKLEIYTNIDGIEWKRDKWKGLAKVFLKFSEKLAVKFSTRVIADNDAIGDYVKKEYKRNASIIAYGGDHALKKNTKGLIFEKPFNKFYLSLCRIEPENNVQLILRTFEKTDEKLAFIGNWNVSSYSRKLHKKYSQHPNIKLIDPIYNTDLLFLYRKECVAYIHGHSAGGTNPSLVEMMHFSKPIIAFDCSFNRKTLENIGFFFKSCEQLQSAISEIDNIDLSAKYKEIADRRYNWDHIRAQYIKLFKEGKI